MNSFYGGKQGSSFIISQTYSTIKEMLDDFGKNNSSCAVNFDEYVLINTVNKNNPENGQVFRRGYDYNSSRKIKTYQPTYGQANPYETIEVPANGAVYIGTIVGPAGRTPIFNLGNYEEVQDSCALLTRTFTDMELNKNNSQQTIVTTLNKKYPNGKEILKEGEKEKSFYSLKIVDNLEAPSIYYYFCYDNKYKLSNQEYGGWYAVDSRPATGEDEYRIETDSLIPGVTYAYDETNTSLIYEYDKNKNRHIKLGINKINEDKINKGKEIEAEDMPYQDSIDWTYCTIRNENLEDSTAYVGFRFAYPVVEFETKQVSAYYNRNDKTDEEEDDKATRHFDNVNLITRMVRDYAVDKEGNPTDVVENRPATKDDIEKHPFYSLWEIAIPKGIKGESLCNFRVITANENVKALDLKDGKIQYDEKGYIKTIKDYSNDLTINKQDDIAKQRQIFVFDIISYDRVPEGDVYTIYAGDYNVFEKDNAVKLSHNGELTFTYTHDDQYKTPQDDWIHWIDAILFKEDGTVTVTFNDSKWNVDQSDSKDKIENGILTKTHLLHWINQMNFADDGTVTVNFNNEDLNDGQIVNGNITLPQLIKWITEVKLDEKNGKFEIDFNYPEKTNKDGSVTKTHYENNLTWLKYFNVDEQGNITYTYTYDTDTSVSRTDNNVIKWINNISLNTDNGEIYIEFNNNSITGEKIKTKTIETENGSKEVSYYQDYLQWVKNIEVKNDGTVNYDGTQQDYSQDKLIKWINKFSLDESNGRLYIEFNNDSVEGLETKNIGTEEEPKFVSFIEQDLTWVKDIEFKNDGTVITDYTTNYQDGVDKREQLYLMSWIKQMNFAEDGTLTVNFNNNSLNDGQIESGNIILPQLIKWITEVKLNNENGKFEIDFNYPEKTNKDGSVIPNTKTHYEADLTWVKNITFDTDGTVTTDYTTEYKGEDRNSEGNRVQSHLMSWINQMALNDDGTLIVNFNNNSLNDGQINQGVLKRDKLIKWINHISLNERTGEIYIEFNNNSIVGENIKTKTINTEEGSKEVSYYQNYLQWIKNIEIDDYGTVKYNGTQQESTQEQLITWIKSCSFDETTGNLKIDFNNNKTVSNIDTTINFIKQVAVTPTGQVLVLYSDPSQQGTISYNNIDKWMQMSQLYYSQYLSVNSTDEEKDSVINNLTPGASCYWIEEIE